MDEKIQEREQEINGVGSSPGGSFPSLSSSHSSGDNKMIPYVSPIGKVGVLKFEDTLSEEDHRGFNLIYESLLLEGRVANLTDLTMGMVLVEKTPAWLQVMHKSLKHLIISLETFKKKKRAEHIAQAGVEKPQKGIRQSGISREGKGKRFGKGKLGATTTSHLSARHKLASNLTIGISG